MHQSEVLHYLKNDRDGFYGARLEGSEQVIYPHNLGVIVETGENERLISLTQFDAEFSGRTFQRCEPVN